MIDEQIKSEIARQVDDQFRDLKKSFEILNLPFKSEYRLLLFNGQANGVNLIPNFPLINILNRTLIIKSFRIVPYYNGAGIDFSFSDGTTEAVWNGSRIERLFDDYANGTYVNLRINGTPVSMFTNVGISGFPADLFIDNIYYKFPDKITDLDLQINSRVINDLSAGALVVPLVKAYMEVYLI